MKGKGGFMSTRGGLGVSIGSGGGGRGGSRSRGKVSSRRSGIWGLAVRARSRGRNGGGEGGRSEGVGSR
jgi:hypothetical protein